LNCFTIFVPSTAHGEGGEEEQQEEEEEEGGGKWKERRRRRRLYLWHFYLFRLTVDICREVINKGKSRRG
jgi:hypothetical protein